MLRTWARAFRFGLARAFGGAIRRPMVSLLSTGAIGVALLLVGVVGLAALNVQRLTAPWGHGVQMVVYLKDGVSPQRAQQIGQALAGVPAVEKVAYVAPDEAYRRLSDSLGDRKDLLAGVEVGFLPASLEVTLAGGVKRVAEVSPFVERLKSTPGVDEVEFLGDWVERLTSLLAALRIAALALGLVVAVACIYVIAGTIKLGMFARKDELEVLRLVGATDGFIKLPLVAEGALQGTLGASLATGLLFLFYKIGAPPLERLLGNAIGDLRLSFLPLSLVGLAIAAGALLGVAGSWVAIGRHAEV